MIDNQKTNIRAVALDALMLICEEGHYSHIVMNQALDKYAFLSKQDRALLSKLIHGTLEYIVQIDYVISKYSSVKIGKLKPVVREILRMSIYQLLYLDRIPERAVCDEAVKLTVKRGLSGLKGYVNGVLRSIARTKSDIKFDTLSLKYSMPKWIIGLFKTEYDDAQVQGILEAFLKEQPLCVRVNTSKCTVEQAVSSIESSGCIPIISDICSDIIYIEGITSISELTFLNEGLVSIQDLSSALVCKIADIKQGDHVIDVCAAPGGKSLHAADILKGSGVVTAYDISELKTKIISENIKKSGFKNISAEIGDATVYQEDLDKTADVLLADLPCSGLGIIGGKPDIKMKATYENCLELANLQKSMLDNISNYVKVGGKLVFSTCTIDIHENAENREYFLNQHPEYKPLDISEKIPEGLHISTGKDGVVNLIPGVHNCDGFYIAVFKRER